MLYSNCIADDDSTVSVLRWWICARKANGTVNIQIDLANHLVRFCLIIPTGLYAQHTTDSTVGNAAHSIDGYVFVLADVLILVSSNGTCVQNSQAISICNLNFGIRLNFWGFEFFLGYKSVFATFFPLQLSNCRLMQPKVGQVFHLHSFIYSFIPFFCIVAVIVSKLDFVWHLSN